METSSLKKLEGRIHRNEKGGEERKNNNLNKKRGKKKFVQQAKNANINDACTYKGSKKKTWAFIGIEIVDANRRVEFEILKICETDFYSEFDWSTVILLLVGILSVFIATLSLVPVSLETRRDRNTLSEEPRANLTVGVVLFFILTASGILTLAFFYPNAFLLIYTVGLCIIGTFLIGIYFFQLIQMGTKRCPQLRIAILKKILYKELAIAEVVGYGLAFMLFIWWLYTKNWLLNNIIAILFVQCLIRIIRVKSLMIGTLLLSALFIYDVFWVFFSASVFGSNVMVTVATNLELPIKILIPYFNPRPTSQCTLIGVGDLVMPGLVIAFSYKVSKRLKTYVYYAANIFAYVFALVLCEIMIYLYQKAQPALLYISPLVLSSFYIVALIRKEFKMVWRGVSGMKFTTVSQTSIPTKESISLFPTHHSVK